MKLNREKAKELYDKIKKEMDASPKHLSFWLPSGDRDIAVETPEEFYARFNKPAENPAYNFLEQVQAETGKKRTKLVNPNSTFLEFSTDGRQRRFRKVGDTDSFAKLIEQSQTGIKTMRALREQEFQRKVRGLKSTMEWGDSVGYSDGAPTVQASQQSMSGYEVKHEYTPLLGSPFYKQMYLSDYWLMHSKCFWYKNYSGPAKLLIQIIRNFVVGEGFSVTISDQRASDAWKAYEDRSGIHEMLSTWCDEGCFGGELMIEKKFSPSGLLHVSTDPSTIWDIITDPEMITDVKYYHQQYNTQYQLFSTPDAAISEYVIRQIPPELMHHVKFNVTSWEKRGRSDLLAGLLYMKYFDDYMGFKLQRVKAEAAYFWDVTVKGDADAVRNYIQSTLNQIDVPPGSENVHNEAITRQGITPSLSQTGSDDVAKWILSYIFMSANIPTSYAGTLESTGASRASALVSTEPVTKTMEERRNRIKWLLNRIFDDVMIEDGFDPKTIEREFNFPELIVEDRSSKIADVITARQEQTISHQSMSTIIAKELNISNYDYVQEQQRIKQELNQDPGLMDTMEIPSIAGKPGVPAPNGVVQSVSTSANAGAGIAGPAKDSDNDSRTLDRTAIRQQNTSL